MIRQSISGFSPDGVGNSPGKSWDAPHYIDIAKATGWLMILGRLIWLLRLGTMSFWKLPGDVGVIERGILPASWKMK